MERPNGEYNPMRLFSFLKRDIPKFAQGVKPAFPLELHPTIAQDLPDYTDCIIATIDPDVVRQNRGVCLNPAAREIEFYKILRTRVRQRAKSKKLRTLMITSANHNEGKTTTTINTGLVFAKQFGQTVILVDCDFKGQDLHRYLGIENHKSLIDHLIDNTPLNELIVWPGIDKLTLISGSNTAVNATELLSSDMMKALVQEMGDRYDNRYVFFDAPPVLERSEAISMAPLVDAVILVVEAGKTSRADVEKAIRLLPKENFLGCVLNKKRD